jgi:hypothetical protein
MEIKTTEFFKNYKLLPKRNTPEFDQLVDEEIAKCKGGVTVNGIYFSGWLYFYLNHWWIRVDKKDNYGNIVKEPLQPYLRDNEWIRSEALEQCRQQMKGYMEIGLRQGGKSEFEASITGYNALMFQDTQNVIVGGNDPDLNLLKDKIDFGLKKMWEGLAIPRLDKDWRKSMVKLGYKQKNNDDEIWSYLIIRNADGGDNTEAPAGTTAKSFVMDEVGKYPFSQVFTAAKPAFISEFGWRTIPILVGTGGSFEKGEDAQRFFENPEANNFLAFVDPETGAKTCLFMPGWYRQDCKVETTLDKFLVDVRGMELKDTSELSKIIIKVCDKEKAIAKIKAEREEKAKDPDQTDYLKEIMYHPLTPAECFLSSATNFYNGELARLQKAKLTENNITGSHVFLKHDGEKITHEFVPHKRPISSHPVKKTEDKDAPIVIWEMPISNPPYGLYVAGIDPYRQDEAVYSDSLGAVYIYKRMHDISGEKLQDAFVAAYVARPKDKAKWEEQARLLIKYYNAIGFCENDEMSFIDYMIAQGDGHYLAPQPDWLKVVVPNSKVDRKKGIHRSSDAIRVHLRGKLKTYMEEKIHVEKDEKGSVVREVHGISRILDPMLCEEISKWNPDGNFDREVAASLAVSYARHLDPQIGKVNSTEVDPRYKSYFEKNKNKPSTLFKESQPQFRQKGSRIKRLFK